MVFLYEVLLPVGSWRLTCFLDEAENELRRAGNLDFAFSIHEIYRYLILRIVQSSPTSIYVFIPRRGLIDCLPEISPSSPIGNFKIKSNIVMVKLLQSGCYITATTADFA